MGPAARWIEVAPRGQDSIQIALADANPGVAGFFLDGASSATVVALDVDVARGRASALRGQIAREIGRPLASLKVQRGDYSARQLFEWKSRLSQGLSAPGLAWVDWDEARNRVVVAAAATDLGQLRQQARSLGVPESAVIFERGEQMSTQGSLSQRWDDPFGGLEIATEKYTCTLGFSGTIGTTKVFVTNSHCTDVQGGIENTPFRQPNGSWSTTYVGYETADPIYWLDAPCPVARRCRYSDAAVVTSNRPIRKAIARTLGEGTYGPSPNLNFNQTVPITGEQSYPTLGQTVKKTGQVSGITVGNVSTTCADVPISNSDVTLLCQNFVGAYSIFGDSGSPVWIDNGTSATLVGILYGGNGSHTLYGFSSIGNVHNELGAISTY